MVLAMVMLVSALPVFYVQAAGSDVYLKADFDDFALNSTEEQATYAGEYGSISMYWTNGSREIRAVEAPSPETKSAGSFTTVGDTDKALEFNAISGNPHATLYMNVSMPAGVDLYEQGHLVFSANVYVDSFNSGNSNRGNFNVDLRKDSSTMSNLLRFVNNELRAYGPNGSGGENTSTQITRPGKQWFNLKFVFDTRNVTYNLYLDGELISPENESLVKENLCFAGDPRLETDETMAQITTIRMQMLNTGTDTSAKFYFDDMYLGAEEAEPVPSQEPTSEPTNEPTAPPEETSAPVETASPSGKLETYNQSNFDDLELDNRGTASADTANYSGDVGSVYMSWTKNREINCLPAPSPEGKMADTSLSTGDIDKALQFNVVKGDTQSSGNYINISVDPSRVDMYSKDKVVLSMNMYVESYGSKGYVNTSLRYGTAGTQTNNLFRLNNGGKIVTFGKDPETGKETNPTKVDRPGKKWFNIKFEFYPKDRNYDFYLDGELVAEKEPLYNDTMSFPGDPDSSKTPFEEIRMQFLNTNETGYADFYVDDIFFGEEATEALVVNKAYFSNGDTPLVNVPANAQMIYGKADVTYSKFVDDKDFQLLAALYDESGRLQRTWITKPELPDTNLAANVYRTVNLDIPLADVSLDENSTFKLFALKGVDSLTPLAVAGQAGVFTASEMPGANPTIHLVGDSICMSYGENAFPQQGWGYYIGDYFKDHVTINNWALGSRSTKSFIDEGRWNGKPLPGYAGQTVTTGVLNVLQPGDYVFVSMGHNDRVTTADENGYVRGTTIEEYKANLKRFADETRLAGGNVIFITSITEAGQKNWDNKQFVENTLLERAEAMKEVGAEEKVVVLDLNDATWRHFNELGYQKTIDTYFMSKDTVRALFRESLTEAEIAGKTEEEIEALITEKVAAHPYNPIKNNGMDMTHVTDFGADYLAATIAKLLEQSASPLKEYLENMPDKSAGGKIQYNLYPEGRTKAVTFSFDDGKVTDRDVVALLNEYGLKGTFNLVPAWLNTNGFLASLEIKELFDGHEVACHGWSHNDIGNFTPVQFEQDIVNTQNYLKGLVGYDITGYAYPFGGLRYGDTDTITQEDVDRVIEESSLTYARTTSNKMANSFVLPQDFKKWSYQLRVGPGDNNNTTAGAFDKVEKFFETPQNDSLQAMMLFAHGHEIEQYTQAGYEETGWELFEKLLAAMAGHEEAWYATCADIAEYGQSVYDIRVGATTNTVKNVSDRSVWVTLDGEPVELLPNRIIKLQ